MAPREAQEIQKLKQLIKLQTLQTIILQMLMLQNPKESTNDARFDGTEIKLLVSGSKLRMHERFFESTK